MRLSRHAIVLAFLGFIAACERDTPTGDGQAATGEVLEGTISDAMLPTDRVRSEAPLARPEPSDRSTATRGAADDSESERSAEEEEAPAAGETGTPEIEPFVTASED